ncbi:hypothetical protein Scep_019764 [Stephania cephalantha]|uniref:Uncharacterized protein n=1 Tax=Stephania cephalantha TaxID=152367 RepID=A0AAP0IBS3_9MAGN
MQGEQIKAIRNNIMIFNREKNYQSRGRKRDCSQFFRNLAIYLEIVDCPALLSF